MADRTFVVVRVYDEKTGKICGCIGFTRLLPTTADWQPFYDYKCILAGMPISTFSILSSLQEILTCIEHNNVTWQTFFEIPMPTIRWQVTVQQMFNELLKQYQSMQPMTQFNNSQQ